jgi:hypothetical protein
MGSYFRWRFRFSNGQHVASRGKTHIVPLWFHTNGAQDHSLTPIMPFSSLAPKDYLLLRFCLEVRCRITRLWQVGISSSVDDQYFCALDWVPLQLDQGAICVVEMVGRNLDL